MNTFAENTKHARISASELVDGRNYRIESETDFDVINFNEFTVDVMNRYYSDEKTQTINIVGKTTDEIISALNLL